MKQIYIKLDAPWDFQGIQFPAGVDIEILPKTAALPGIVAALLDSPKEFEFTDFNGDRYRADDPTNITKLMFVIDRLISFQG